MFYGFHNKQSQSAGLYTDQTQTNSSNLVVSCWKIKDNTN